MICLVCAAVKESAGGQVYFWHRHRGVSAESERLWACVGFWDGELGKLRPGRSGNGQERVGVGSFSFFFHFLAWVNGASGVGSDEEVAGSARPSKSKGKEGRRRAVRRRIGVRVGAAHGWDDVFFSFPCSKKTATTTTMREALQGEENW